MLAQVEYMTMYMPVDVATKVGTPMPITIGLNTLDAPMPSVPELRPPSNEIIQIYTTPQLLE